MTQKYQIKIPERVIKKLNKASKKVRIKIIEKIDGLALNPRPLDCKKLQDNRRPPLYRIRTGDYRIVYTIQDEILLILILDVGHRKEVYRSI